MTYPQVVFLFTDDYGLMAHPDKILLKIGVKAGAINDFKIFIRDHPGGRVVYEYESPYAIQLERLFTERFMDLESYVDPSCEWFLIDCIDSAADLIKEIEGNLMLK